jgi:hypothetical protein
MSIIVTPSNPAPGQSVVFTLKYEGSPPPPTDVHVQVETPNGWDPVVGYDDIKSVTDETGRPIDPGKGFQLPVPPQNWSKQVRIGFGCNGPERTLRLASRTSST